MERQVSDRNVLYSFIDEFISVVESFGIRYVLVSGIVAISHGRSRGTEDVDMILERISKEKFVQLFDKLSSTGFECLQGSGPAKLYEDYLVDDLAIRLVRKGSFVPEMELKLAKDDLDAIQLRDRVKLPLTGLPYYFSTIETNIAFKEELLKSPKDIGDARHLRVVYSDFIDESKIDALKGLIRKYRLVK